MRRQPHYDRTVPFSVTVTFLAMTAPSIAHAVANPTVAQRIDAAMAEGRYGDVVTLIGELERATGVTLQTQWARAQALLLSGRNAEADTAAAACSEASEHSTEAFAPTARADCLRIRERAQTAVRAATPPAAVPAPSVTVRTVTVPPVRHTVTVPSPVTVATSRSLAPPVPVVALLSVGAASLVTAAVLGTLAGSATSGCAVSGGVATCPSQDELARARNATDYAAGANVALGVGASLTVAAGVWWGVAVALRRPLPVAVAVTSDSVVVGGRF